MALVLIIWTGWAGYSEVFGRERWECAWPAPRGSICTVNCDRPTQDWEIEACTRGE